MTVHLFHKVYVHTNTHTHTERERERERPFNVSALFGDVLVALLQPLYQGLVTNTPIPTHTNTYQYTWLDK